MTSDYETCPTHGEECPGHFHVEYPAEGPGGAYRGNAVYTWPTETCQDCGGSGYDTNWDGTDNGACTTCHGSGAVPTPAQLPTGDTDPADAGWQEIGWVTEDQLEVMLRPRTEEFETVYRNMAAAINKSYSSYRAQAQLYVQTLHPLDLSQEMRDIVFGKPKQLPPPKPDYLTIDLDQVKWTATWDNPKQKLRTAAEIVMERLTTEELAKGLRQMMSRRPKLCNPEEAP